MKKNNVCKFVTDYTPDKITVSCFVLESNPATMRASVRLETHLAALLVSGDGEFVFDNQKINLSSGSLVFGFMGEDFYVNAKDGTEYMYIKFLGTRADELFKRFSISKANRIFSGFESLIPLWRNSLSRASAENIDLAAESLLLYSFSRLTQGNEKQNSIIKKMVEISEEDFSNPELSLSSVSKELGYNSKYLSHIFKEKMGMGYSEYLRTLRIKYAVSLFDHGIDSVKNVAFLCGYTDPLYFSNVFKKSIGLSPKDYKNRKEK